MYNFVIFGIEDDFYRLVFQDLAQDEDVKIIGNYGDIKPAVLKKLYKIHTSRQLNRRFLFPGRGIWNALLFQDEFAEKKPLCFIFKPFQWEDTRLIQYLKKKYPGSKFVMTSRDLISTYSVRYPRFDIHQVKNTFDLFLSYNKYDCEKYGLTYFNTEISYIPIERDTDYPWSDVFFAGAAKDRVEILVKIYEKLTAAGLRCDFYITGAKEEEKKHAGGIQYASHNMPYFEMLQRTVNSRCVLEVSQKNAYGFTTRAFEAILYKKRLITNSLIVKEQEFYKTGFIQFFSDVDDIDPDFVRQEGEADYHYKGEYSPRRILEQIETELAKKDI